MMMKSVVLWPIKKSEGDLNKIDPQVPSSFLDNWKSLLI